MYSGEIPEKKGGENVDYKVTYTHDLQTGSSCATNWVCFAVEWLPAQMHCG